MDEESRKMKDLDSVRTGQGASIVGANNPIEETHEEDKEHTQTTQEGRLQEVDEDLLEIKASFEKNRGAVEALFKEGKKLYIEDLIVFKDRADDVVGYELDEFISFLSSKYSLKKTKFSLNWESIMGALNEWVIFQTEDRKREKVEDWMDNIENDDYPELPDEDELDTEKYRQREKSRDLLTMKLQNYTDQIHDIFKANADQENSDEESDEENAKDLPVQVRVSKLTKVIKDMGLLCGIVFTTWEDYISGKIDEKKTKKEIVDKIKRAMWKDTHLSICIQVLEEKGKKAGDSILKKPSSGESPNQNPSESQDVKAEEHKNDTDAKPVQEIVNEEASKEEETNKEDNDQTEKQDNTEKPEKTEKEGSSSSHSDRPETSKSATAKSTTTKKTKTVVEEEKTELRTQNEDFDQEEFSGRKVLFEEESYQAENRYNYIEIGTFMNLLRQFFEEDEEMVILDHLHEYDDEIAEAFRAATEIGYDPFLEKLKKTLSQYESALIKGDFKDENEREATEGLVQDIRNQIAKISQSRIQSNTSDRDSKKKPLTLEELRKRGLKELFTFYSKQHLPEGLEFGDILNKLEVIDLGEFCIFARDFDLKIPKKKMIEIFKKTSNLRHQPLNFKQFVEVLDKIGVAMNDQRIKDIKKRLMNIEKIENEQNSKPAETSKEKSGKNSDSEDDASDEEKKTVKQTEESKETNKEETSGKASEKDEGTEKPDGKTDKKDSDQDSDEDSDTESKSKITKTNPVTDSKSLNTQSKNVEFAAKDGETSAKEDRSDSESDSEEETNPLKIEKKKLQKELEKYENYGHKEAHDEIMNYLEIHNPEKYRLKAKGVLVVPFFMKGKYGKPTKSLSQQGYSHTSTDGMSERKALDPKLIKKKRIINKEKIERIKQYKLKSRNNMGSEGGILNTLSPTSMGKKLNPNANLLKQSKTKVSILPKAKQSQKVTLESLQNMNLKEFNNKRNDDFKPRDVLTDDDAGDDESVFNYFFPENKKPKGKGKKTTTNKFAVKKAIIKEPIDQIDEEDVNANYYTEQEKPLSKKAKSKLGNITERGLHNSKNNETRRSLKKSALTARGSKKSTGKPKSSNKTKPPMRGKSKSKSKSKPKYGIPSRKSSQKTKILSRAAQYDKQNKLNEKATLNKMLKLHDAQMQKGYNVLKKKKI
ncbi:unnamed protein product [Moneuplotes crassus]|uniref:Uncharacterized protein n=1 Tax=Euplotes crassus TaxID=5936 RepID=A0AAD1XI38_EUPCR|nr:unnamed protein product [Moneuplotes crassus]